MAYVGNAVNTKVGALPGHLFLPIRMYKDFAERSGLGLYIFLPRIEREIGSLVFLKIL